LATSCASVCDGCPMTQKNKKFFTPQTYHTQRMSRPPYPTPSPSVCVRPGPSYVIVSGLAGAWCPLRQGQRIQQGTHLSKSTPNSVSFAGLTDLQRKDLQRVSAYLPTALKTFQLAYAHKSMAKTVKAKCIECCNLEKAHIANCPISGCPLWTYRPYQPKLKYKTCRCAEDMPYPHTQPPVGQAARPYPPPPASRPRPVSSAFSAR